MVHLYKSPTNIHERIKVLRTKVILHREIAKQSLAANGLYHYDTIHNYDVLEELYAKLHSELRKMQIEQETQRSRKEAGWDICMMNRSYEI